MNTKILLASFGLVFLAELGDKTQLTALAFSSATRSPWSVFLGTSLALICTTALAVVCGEALTRVVPERILHLASAVMFVLVGLILLVNLARKAQPAAPATEAAPAAEGALVIPPGPLSRFVARQAVAFEEELAGDIRQAMQSIADPALRQALQDLERRHRGHAEALTGLEQKTVAEHRTDIDDDLAKGHPERLLTALRDAGQPGADDDAVAGIIRRQEAAAEFYIALARLVRFHDARDVLRALAMEEVRLAQETCALVNHERPAANHA